MALDREPEGWNPNKPAGAVLTALMQHVLPSPFRVLPDFSVVMDDDLLGRAEQTSEDPQTVVYEIRDDAVWSDGVPISGDDFVYMWEQTLDLRNDVASTEGYEDIASVTASDDGKTVTVVFAERYADWRSLFDHLLPAHVMGDIGWDGLEGANTPEFSGGPLQLEDYEPGQSLRLTPNERYWGSKEMRLDEVVVRFGIEGDEVAAAFENGEVDVAFPAPEPHIIEAFEELGDEVGFATGTGLTFEHLDFDLENPILQDRAVRRAIALAIDESAVAERVGRAARTETSPLYNRIFARGQDFYEAHGRPYRGVDLERAQQVLRDAGFSLGDDGVFVRPDGTRLSLRLSTTGGNALRQAAQSMLVSQLAVAGIEITVDNEPGDELFGRVFPGDPSDRDFDVALFSWVRTPFPSNNEPLYTTGGPANNTAYSSAEADGLFEEARGQLDTERAAATYNQIDELLWDDLPTVPLYATPSFLVWRADVVNVEDNVTTAGPLWNIWEWRRRTD